MSETNGATRLSPMTFRNIQSVLRLLSQNGFFSLPNNGSNRGMDKTSGVPPAPLEFEFPWTGQPVTADDFPSLQSYPQLCAVNSDWNLETTDWGKGGVERGAENSPVIPMILLIHDQKTLPFTVAELPGLSIEGGQVVATPETFQYCRDVFTGEKKQAWRYPKQPAA